MPRGNIVLLAFLLFSIAQLTEGSICLDQVSDGQNLQQIFENRMDTGCNHIVITINGLSDTVLLINGNSSLILNLIVQDLPVGVPTLNINNFANVSIFFSTEKLWTLNIQATKYLEVEGGTFSAAQLGQNVPLINLSSVTRTKIKNSWFSFQNPGNSISVQNVGSLEFLMCTFYQSIGFVGSTSTPSNLTFTNSIFRGNTKLIDHSDMLVIRDCIFENNIADPNIVLINSKAVNISNTVFNNNIGKALINCTSLSIQGSEVTNNQGEGNLGIMYVRGGLSVNNCSFIENHLVGDLSGGVLTVLGAARIYSSNFTLNSNARGQGAAISSGFRLVVEECRFNHNSAQKGGAISTTDGLEINYSYFSGNSAPGDGGAVLSESVVTITFSRFLNNTSGNRGGAIYSAGIADITSSNFSSNTAGQGGAINAPSVLIQRSFLTSNLAQEGGAIQTLGASVHIRDCIIQENCADKGYAISSNGTVVISGSYTGGGNVARDPVSRPSYSIVAPQLLFPPQQPDLGCDWLNISNTKQSLGNGTEISFAYTNKVVAVRADQKPGFHNNSRPYVVIRTTPTGGSIMTDFTFNRAGKLTYCQFGSQIVTNSFTIFESSSCNLTRGVFTMGLSPSEVCFIPGPFYFDSSVMHPDPIEEVKESINKIIDQTPANSTRFVESAIYSAVVFYFNTIENAMNPLIIKDVNASVTAFDLSRKQGDSVLLDLDLWNTSTTFPNSVLDEVLSRSTNSSNAFLILTTYEKVQRFFEELPTQGSIVYGLSLVAEDSTVIDVENTSSPILISMSLNPNLTQEQLDEMECLWWDEVVSDWKNTGCMKKNISSVQINCECYHLTNFSAGVRNQLQSTQRFNENNSSKFNSVPVGLIVGLIVGLVALIVIIMIMVVFAKKIMKKKQSDVELNKLGDVDKRLIWEEKIGKGAFCTVYKALDSGTTTVAVKKLNAKEEKSIFLKECNILKSLHHPNIIQFLKSFEDTDGSLCMMLEYMSGGDLLTALRTKDMVSKTKIKVAFQIAGALRYLASMGYVHCDISARNVLLKEGPIAKLSDFGHAKEIDQLSLSGDLEKIPVRWIAPEVWMDKMFTPNNDVWSFGILIFEILSDGEIPYGKMSNEEVISFVKKGGILRAPEGSNEKELIKIMESCLREASDRPGFDQISSGLGSIYGDASYSKTDELDHSIYVIQP